MSCSFSLHCTICCCAQHRTLQSQLSNLLAPTGERENVVNSRNFLIIFWRFCASQHNWALGWLGYLLTSDNKTEILPFDLFSTSFFAQNCQSGSLCTERSLIFQFTLRFSTAQLCHSTLRRRTRKQTNSSVRRTWLSTELINRSSACMTSLIEAPGATHQILPTCD